MMSPTLATQFRDMGVNFERLEPAYPLELWVRSLHLTMDTLHPGKPRDVASYEVGRRMVEAMSETMLGTALFSLLKVLGPKRGLMRMARNLRSSNNYSEATVLEVSPGNYELTLNMVNYPQYYRGMLEAGMSLMGAREPRVSVLSYSESHDARFRVEFQ